MKEPAAAAPQAEVSMFEMLLILAAAAAAAAALAGLGYLLLWLLLHGRRNGPGGERRNIIVSLLYLGGYDMFATR